MITAPALAVMVSLCPDSQPIASTNDWSRTRPDASTLPIA
jgi:hypothetical protein